VDGSGGGKGFGPKVDLSQNISSLELKGILEDRRGKVAVIAAATGSPISCVPEKFTTEKTASSTECRE